MYRRVIVMCALLFAGRVAEAQIIRPVSRFEPSAWASLGIGWLQQQGFCDADRNECYDFGGAPQWRATLDIPFGRSTSLGLVGSIARAPIVFQGGTLAPNSCASCDADVNVSQVMGNLRMGGGIGIHQVIDISAGTTMYSNFRATNGTRLGDGTTANHVTVNIGYGFGYGMSERAQFFLVQDFGLMFLKRQAGTTDNNSQHQTLRLGGRVALGGRRR